MSDNLFRQSARNPVWNYSSHFKAAAFGLVISDSFYLRVQLASDAFAKGSLLWRERLSFRRQEAMS